MFSKPGRAKIGTNPSEIENWAKIRHKSVMLSALQLVRRLQKVDIGKRQRYLQKQVFSPV